MLENKAREWLGLFVMNAHELTFTPVKSSEWSNYNKVPIEEGVATTVYFWYKPEEYPSKEHFQISIEIYFFEGWLSFYSQLMACWLGHPEQLRPVVRYGSRQCIKMPKTLPEVGWPDPGSLINIVRSKLSEKLIHYNVVTNAHRWYIGENPNVAHPCA